jgi:hypothetical protein
MKPFNYGKLKARKIIVPKVSNEMGIMIQPQAIIYQPIQANSDIPWKDVVPDIEEGYWFLAVMPDGYIINAEEDGTAIALTSMCDIWRIKHDAKDQMEIMNKRWDGKNVIPIEEV